MDHNSSLNPRILNICTGGEQRSFHVPVTCTGARKYRADVWWTEWVGYSEDLNCYWGVIDGGLRTGEGCSTANIILKI